ncbi:MAG TPA: SDR family NAD(P)-dependent oxidoreductase [Vicinamibacterales bacterium]|nr:SDR family NAD(P)-dependent oxidoreductase [Vicinamibacterales bacterium]
MFELAGRQALVTGAASGIGAAIAQTFARAGAQVFVTDVDGTAASATAERLARDGGRAEAFALDVRDEAACRQAAERVERAAGRLDVLVNNAGIGHVGTLIGTSGEDLDRLYAVNVRGVFNVTKAFLPGMVARRSGAIINMASIGGLVGIRDRIAYCTSKFAVVGLTRSLALDHARDGVRINCICPGRVETPFVAARLREYPDPDAAYREMAASQPIGRMGRPEEIASLALYLASDEAAFVTGAAVPIDGGWSAG